jgi:hypothetical protein
VVFLPPLPVKASRMRSSRKSCDASVPLLPVSLRRRRVPPYTGTEVQLLPEERSAVALGTGMRMAFGRSGNLIDFDGIQRQVLAGCPRPARMVFVAGAARPLGMNSGFAPSQLNQEIRFWLSGLTSRRNQEKRHLRPSWDRAVRRIQKRVWLGKAEEAYASPERSHAPGKGCWVKALDRVQDPVLFWEVRASCGRNRDL